jgi:hypothetical protein
MIPKLHYPILDFQWAIFCEPYMILFNGAPHTPPSKSEATGKLSRLLQASPEDALKSTLLLLP